jgi:hypothetical protein
MCVQFLRWPSCVSQSPRPLRGRVARMLSKHVSHVTRLSTFVELTMFVCPIPLRFRAEPSRLVSDHRWSNDRARSEPGDVWDVTAKDPLSPVQTVISPLTIQNVNQQMARDETPNNTGSRHSAQPDSGRKTSAKVLPESPGHDCSVPASLILASKHDTKTCVKSLTYEHTL